MPPEPKKPHRRSLVSTTGVILVFVGVAFYGFSQTATFRAYLRAQALDLLTAELRGELSFGAITGNLLTGFSIDSLRVAVGGQPLLEATALEVRYNPLVLLVDVPRFRRITLIGPRVHLWRTAENQWNIQNLLPPPAPDTSSSTSTLRIERLEIVDGEITMVDSSSLSRRPDPEEPIDTAGFNYARLFLHGLTLRASVRLDGDLIEASIRELAFTTTEPSFELRALRGEFEVRQTAVSVRGFSMETGGSSLTLDATMQDIDLLGLQALADLADSPVDVALQADRVDLRELRQFLPRSLSFLDKTVGADVEATGRFGRLRVENLTLRMPKTFLSLEGTISNLHRPADLELDVRSTEAVVHGTDALDHLPGLHLPDLSGFGSVEMTLSFVGMPTNFQARVDGSSERGSFLANATLDLRDGHFSYDADVTSSGFDLSGFSSDPALKSSVNLHGIVSGQGTDPATMTSVARVEIDSSEFLGIPWGRSVLIADAADAIVRLHTSLAPRNSRLEASAEIAFKEHRDLPSYTFEGAVASLDLADFTGQDRFSSDLSFELDGSGEGFSFEELQSTIEIRFLRSSFRNESFENQTLRATYAAHDPLGRHLTVTSAPLDIEVYGTLTPPQVIASTIATINGIAQSLESQLGGTAQDSLFLPAPLEFPGNAEMDSAAVEQSRFTARIRDFYPLGVLANRPLRGSGSLGGTLTQRGDERAITASAYLPEVLGEFGSTVLYGHRLSADLTAHGVRTPTGIALSDAAFQGGVERALVNAVPWDKISVHGTMRSDSLVFGLGLVYDSLLSARIEGSAFFRDSAISVILPYAKLGVPALELQNDEPIRFTVLPNGLRVHSLTFSNDAEELTASGTLGLDSLSQFSIALKNFLLSDLHRFSRDDGFVSATRDLGGIVNLNGQISGPLDHPSYRAELTAQGVRIRESVLGQVSGRGSYARGTFDVFFELRSKPEDQAREPDLLIAGTLPLQPPDQASKAVPINLAVRSKNFNLQYLDPIFPHVTNLTGSAQCDMEVRGTLDQPEYNGFLTIKEARFLLLPLDLEFQLDGSLIPRGGEVSLEDVRLQNLPQRENNGVVFAGGVSLSGLTVKEFDVTATGELQLMSRASRTGIQSLYGDLTATTSRQGVRWRGGPEHSVATGEVFLKRTALTLPPTRSDILDREQRISIVFVDDTSGSGRIQESERYLFRPGGETSSEEDLLSLARARVVADSTQAHAQPKTFLDKVVYSLTVETIERSTFTIIVDRFTNERLVAYLDGRLAFQKDADQTRLIGEVKVGEGSFYHYIRQFDASGKLMFTGDPANPELDITAKYEDFRASRSAEALGDTTATQLKAYRVVITLSIKGDRKEPRVILDLERTSPDGRTEPSFDPQGDAISYLISGKFKDELTPQERSSLLTTSLAGIGSSILSSPLTELMRRELGFVSSVDVLYYGGNIKEQTDIRLSGKVGDAVIQFGGRVFSDIGNANVNIQLPMSSVLGSESWRNFVFELSRQTDPFETSDQRSEPTNSAKLVYRIIF